MDQTVLVSMLLFNSNWMYHMLYFFLEEFQAVHVSDAMSICTDHQEHNCSVQPQDFVCGKQNFSMAVHCSFAPDDGCK
jgi:hypothetical protein